MTGSGLNCKDEARRDAVRAAPLFGLDHVEVDAAQTTLTVFFLGKAPPAIEKRNVVVTGGTRVTGIQVTGIAMHRQADPALDDAMDVRVNKAGDFSTYTLSMAELGESGRPTGQPMPGFDPLYASVDFSFKGGCPTGLDCLSQHVRPQFRLPQPEINYLAKDYAAFRQLILDRLALIMPTWRETHEPDIGLALVEILAYVADYLSYYQDAVATEAYLGTAHQRISVRRHVRLIDYAMHEGCNARAWLTLETDTDMQFNLSAIYFTTGFPGAPADLVLTPEALANVPASSYEVFQPLHPVTGTLSIYQAHNKISFYTWGNDLCCIAPGATSATLVDDWIDAPAPSSVSNTDSPASDGPPGTIRRLSLKPGDVLIFEEVLGPKTGKASDADPTHRQAVRLISVTPSVDPLYAADEEPGQPILEIQWAAEDALTFPMCLSVRHPAPDCRVLYDVSVARGNVLLVDHGATTIQDLGVVPTASKTANCPSPCYPALVQTSPGLYRPTLKQAPLTFSQPFPSGGWSASGAIGQDPRLALPDITLSSIPAAPAADSDSSSCILPLFQFGDIEDPTRLAHRLKRPTDIVSQYLAGKLSPASRHLLRGWNGAVPLPAKTAASLKADLNALLDQWLPVADLLESEANDFSFVVEIDNPGYGHLRFGDGRLGREPDAGMGFQATYRVGNGPAGNVGAGAISYLVLRDEKLSGANIVPRNPLPASGGTAHEPLSEVKLIAPFAFKDVIERAITAEDYATLAADNARRLEQRSARDIGVPFVALQRAQGTLRWTGGWYEALVAVDPMNTEHASPELLSEIHAYLEPYRRIGHDLTLAGANYVPLDLALSVCVLPDYLRAQVEDALLQVLGNGVQPDGAYGFFNPNNLTFGQPVYISQIVAAAQAVAGVASVSVTRLERYQTEAHPYPARFGIASGAVPALGVLGLGPFEIAQLDNDPNYPEHGRLKLTLRGGR